MSRVAYYTTLTRCLGVVYSGEATRIQVGKRNEDLVPGDLLVVDLTKRGTPLSLPDSIVIRCVQAQAVEAAKWTKVSDEADPLLSLLFSRIPEEEKWVQENHSLFLSSLPSSTLGIYEQRCAVKIVLNPDAENNMATQAQRAFYASLLRGGNGTPLSTPPFDMAYSTRYLVTEPVLKKGQLAAVYHKPLSHLSRDWEAISEEEAFFLLSNAGRVVNWEQVEEILSSIRSFVESEA